MSLLVFLPEFEMKKTFLLSTILIILLVTGCEPAPGEDAIPMTLTAAIDEFEGSSADASQFDTATATPKPRIPAIEMADLHPVYDTTVELHYAERWMRVDQTVAFTNASDDEWEEIVFNIIMAHTPDSFHMDELTLSVDGIVYDIFEDSGFIEETMYHIPLPDRAQPGAAVRVDFGYRVLIPPIAPTDWPPNGTTGWTLDLIQAGEFYPTLIPYSEDVGWMVWDYVPVGDMAVYPLSDYHLEVITQPGVMVVSSGLVENDGTTWVFDVPNARGVAFFASENYKCSESEYAGIPIKSCYLPDYEEPGVYALTIAEESLAYFTDIFGNYPYKDLVIVENGFFGGMEYSGLVSITGSAYYGFNGGADSILAVLTAHEIAHQWFYGAVGSDQVRESWIDESIAFYSELLFIEHYYPDYETWWWDIRVDRFSPQGTVDATVYEYADSASFILWMYGQAAYFLSDVRDVIGDEAFFNFLYEYYRDYRWEMASKADYLSTLQAQTDQDLTFLLVRYFEFPEY